MYTGRILSIGMNCDGKPFVAYRVSSRSFPNRQCLKFDNRASIVPKEGFEKDIFENHCHCFDHGGYGYTQVPVPKTERWIVHKENEDSKNKK